MTAYRTGEPRRCLVLSVQVLNWIQMHDHQLHDILKAGDMTDDVLTCLTAVDSIRLVEEAQDAVVRVREALGVSHD